MYYFMEEQTTKESSITIILKMVLKTPPVTPRFEY